MKFLGHARTWLASEWLSLACVGVILVLLALIGRCGRPPVHSIAIGQPIVVAELTAVSSASNDVEEEDEKPPARAEDADDYAKAFPKPSVNPALKLSRIPSPKPYPKPSPKPSGFFAVSGLLRDTVTPWLPVDDLETRTRSVFDHGHLGLCVGTFPGLVALDLQLVRVGLSYSPYFEDAEVSLDAMLNWKMAGLQLTSGHSFFVGAGGYYAFDGSYGGAVSTGFRF